MTNNWLNLLQCLVQPVEDSQVTKTGALGFAVKISAILYRELCELLRANEKVVQLSRLPWPVSFVYR